MALFENFPYVNFHELNLDWIMKTVKDFQENYTTIDETIENGKTEIDDEATEALAELDRNLNDALSRIEYSIQTTQRRFIILADSYGNRLNAAGKTFGQMVQEALGIPSDNYHYAALPGASFGTNDGSLKYLTMLQAIEDDHPETITDIIVECGANDNYIAFAQVNAALEQFANYAKVIYPKAKIYLFACGLTMEQTRLYDRKWATLQAFKNASQYGMAMIQNSDSILMNSLYLDTDRIHPNSSGVSWIGWQLIHAILTGNCYDNTYRLSTVDMNPTLTIENLSIVINSYTALLNITRNNNQLFAGSINYIDIGFGDYNVQLTSNHYVNIEIDNCLGLFADQNWYPCSFVTLDGVSHMGSYTFRELSNGKYQIRIRPRYDFRTGANVSHVHIYFGTMTNQ